jgi:hypothetical protein
MLKSIRKYVKAHHIIALIGVVVIGIAIYQYSTRKSSILSGMKNEVEEKVEMKKSILPADPKGENEKYAQASGLGSQTIAKSCDKKSVADPSELLPKDENSAWAKLNPAGNGDLKNVNLLKAGYHTGIDTVGNSLRNANLQLRSEPANPQVSVGPWNNTTISPDLMRTPLQLGQGPQ